MKILGRVSKEDFHKFLNYGMDLKDKLLYKELAESQYGVFEFSGDLASKQVKEAKPETFEDVCVINATSRPGASSQFPAFVEAKTKGTKKYPEQLDSILGDSRGIIVYQEQIMNAFAKMAGYSPKETNCFVGETEIETPNGKKFIKDLKEGDKVYSYNFDINKVEEKEVSAFMPKGKKKIIELELDNGKKIRLTPEHLIYTKNRGYVKAIDLTEEDELLDYEKND